MFLFLLILLLVWVILTLVLSAWTLWFQSYIYTEPATGILWRGPAAGGAVMAFVCLWVILDYRNPGAYRPLHEFEATEDQPPFEQLMVPTRAGKEVYQRIRTPEGKFEYRLNGKVNGKIMPSRPEKIIPYQRVKTPEGKIEYHEEGSEFVRQPAAKHSSWSLNKASETLEWRDSKGRVMQEISMGQITTFRGGRLLVNLLVNGLFLGVLFVAFWLLLGFQWSGALGQALVAWLVLGLCVMPPLLSQAEKVARERAEARAAR